MAKTEETLIIEDVLYQNLFGSNPCLAREYGTKEVTVTLLKEKKVKEIVDFLSYNAKKDEFRCYEIKVSMADFKSKAAKTWIGNYNYLVIPRELYLKQSLYEWKEQIPYYVGIIVVNVERRSKWVAKRPAPMEVSAGMKFMLRQSLIRTLFYQNDKLKKNSAAKIEQICQETENFHVRMRECDLLKLYQYYIFDRSRQRLIVNAKPYDNDQLYVNILGNRINLNDILIGDHYKWNPEKFPKIYDGSFKDFLESFDFEANGICRVHDSIYASDENDILIGRKMKSVIDKLF